jgi:hypothetical protein
VVLKYTLAWIGLVFLAIFNGTARVSLYQPLVGDQKAHQISTLTAIILFGLYVWILSGKWKIESSRQALHIGLIWLGLTAAFEFLFGHYVMKNPWSTLFHDYNLFAGRLWILVLIFTVVVPYLCFKLRSKMS